MRRTLSVLTILALFGAGPAAAVDDAPTTPDWQPDAAATQPARGHGKSQGTGQAKSQATGQNKGRQAAKVKRDGGGSAGVTPTSPMRSISREDIDTGPEGPGGPNFRPMLRQGGVGMNMGF